MKRFLILMLAIGMMAVSCKQELAVKYNFLIQGEASGQVDLQFPGGSLVTSGEVVLDFRYGNIELEELTFQAACEDSRIEVREFALMAEKEVEEEFSVAGWKYDLILDAEAYEETLGVKIKFHKEFKN